MATALIEADKRLTETDYQVLIARWITPALADIAGLYRVNSIEGGNLVGRSGSGISDYSGIAIPYYWPGKSEPFEYQLRRDHPDMEAKPDGSLKERMKYICAPGRGNRLYLNRDTTAGMLEDTNLPIIFTEGVFKAIALWRLAINKSEYPEFLPVALMGVWNWRGIIGKEPSADGTRTAIKGPISDLDCFSWNGRTVYILFDSDSVRNASVQTAEREFARELSTRSAIVKIIELPDLPGLEKTGADDFLAHPEGRPDRMLALIDAARDYEPDLLKYLQNDHGNAERLIVLSGHCLRYCHPMKKWLVWDGRRWGVDTTRAAYKLAKDAMLEYVRQAHKTGSETHEKFSRQSLDTKKINALLESAQCEIFIQPELLDTHPYLLNCLNGVVDLRTGELQAHQADLYITRLVHQNYLPEAQCKLWKICLHRLMGMETNVDRAEHLVNWIQKALGYSLTGITREKAVFICWGPTDAGKSTLLSTFRNIVEEYSAILQIDTLMTRKEENNNSLSDLSDLQGRRFVQTSETEKGQRLAEGKLKRISQGIGKIKACRKYENPIEFSETHKLWIDANHKPAVKGNDGATWNRLYPIPFTVSIPKEEQDKELPEKLMAEAEGILAWAVAGAVRWYAEGLGKPEEIESANREWRDSEDLQGRFLSECTCKSEDCVETAEVYRIYQWWCNRNGEQSDNSNSFGRAMSERGFERGYTGVTRHATYKNLSILPEVLTESTREKNGKNNAG